MKFPLKIHFNLTRSRQFTKKGVEPDVDNELFELAVKAALRIPKKDVIGTKSEHRVHGALKYLFQPCDAFHEIKVDGFICDAVSSDGNGVYEIQTRGFGRLRKKLDKLLKSHKVTVIYPIISEKRIISIYEENGETTVRKSPKKHTFSDLAGELSAIRGYLEHPNLSIVTVRLKIDETRVFAGKKGEKKPFQKPLTVEKIPTELLSTETIVYPDYYLSLIPDSLDDTFVSGDFAKARGITADEARYLLYLLNELHLVTRTDRDKRGYIYKRSHP